MRTNALCCSAKDLYLHVASSFLALSLLINSPLIAQAQVTPPITSSGLNTTVTQNGNTYNITGGTRPSGGVNLFHSFGEFGVPANNIANFLNETPNLATSNILGRVTGGNISNIFGTIQTTNFGSANLFLMNPAGFLFGPNATVNVGGMVAFTTADYLRLSELNGSNPGIFHADPAQASVLTTAPVAAYGFLGSTPGAITVQGSQFIVTAGQSIALVGGDITIGADPETGTPAYISAPGGRIDLVSVASPGEILYPSLQKAPNINGQSFTAMGAISLVESTFLDVSDYAFEVGGSGGTVRILGGQLIMDNAIILSATQGDVDGAPIAADINISGDVSLNNSFVGSQASAGGRAGDINIQAQNVTIEGPFSLVDTRTDGDGQAGNITITASGSVSVMGTDGFGNSSSIQSGTFGSNALVQAGDSGQIIINAASVALADQGGIKTTTETDGNAGSITLTVDSVNLTSGGFIQTRGVGQGATGSITVTATDTVSLVGDPQLNIAQQSAFTNFHSGTGAGGGISVSAKNFQVTDGAQIVNRANTSGGPVNITASDSILISGGSEINSQTFFGSIGPIQLSAAESITLSDQAVLRGSTIGSGTGGTISLTAESISLSSQSFITSRTISSGQGGQVQLNASDSVSLSSGAIITTSSLDPATGAAGSIAITAGNAVSLSGAGTKILSETAASGNGGTITIQTNQGQIIDGAVISAKSTGSGAAGSVTIQGNSPAQSVLIDGAGSGIFTNTQGTGAGGNIFVNANSVTLQNGGTLSAKTTGAGNAGNIQINTAALEVTTGGQITSSSAIGESGETPTGSAGNVTVQGLSGPADSVLISGMDENYNFSGIFTDTQGTGAGGNINVAARSVTIQDGGTISASTSGTGPLATGGTIMLETESLRLDAGTITAGAFGDNTGQAGNVTIISKTIDAANFSFINTFTTGIGQAGNILLKATESITLLDSFVNSDAASFSMTEAGNGGFIHLNAPTIDLRSSLVSTTTLGAGNAGNILLEAQQLSLRASEFGALNRQGTNILTLTQGPGQAGTITVRGLGGDSTIAGEVAISGASLLSSRTNNTGNAGSIVIDTLRLDLSDSGNVTTGTQGTGAGGTITVHAHQIQLNNQATITATSSDTGNAGNVTIKGFASPAQSVLIDGLGSGIFTDTHGTGAGGNISLNANTITLQNGGTMSAATSGIEATATGGTILVEANQVQLNNGGLITTSSTGAGAGGSITIGAGSTFASNASTVSSTAAKAHGGDIAITAGQSVTLNNGSSISASSSGGGNAGNILINAGQNYTSTDSAVTTQAAQASGGNITVLATDMVQLTNSQLNASVQGSSTTVGGNITIDPLYIILLNSQVLAQAAQGQGGAISFTITNGGLYLPDATSTVSASSQFGVNGIVTIQSPNAPASGKIIPLSQKPLLATSLLNQRCAALAGGEFSSFTVAGRDSLPIEPGSWLASPLATLNAGTGLRAQGEGREGMTPGTSLADETTLLSLRQISPAGFLTQSFAVEGSTGCQS